MYGKEDPWVKPMWGLQVKRQVPEAPYYQISPAGHCPHDEVPEVCNPSLISLQNKPLALKVYSFLIFYSFKLASATVIVVAILSATVSQQQL